MQNDYNQDELEDFLKRNADDLRMRPSAKIWQRIDADLNKRRRRVGFVTAAFLLLSGCLGYFIVDSSRHLAATDPVASGTLSPSGSSQLPALTDPSTSGSLTEAPQKTTAKVINIQSRTPKSGFPLLSQPAGAASDASLLHNVLESASAASTAGTEALVLPLADSAPFGEAPADKTVSRQPDNSERLLSIESVYNSFKKPRGRKKLVPQYFFAPTLSYRRLTENKSYLRSLPSNTPQTVAATSGSSNDVNNYVTHKPDMGLEVGFGVKYPIARSLSLRGGLQLNVTRYDIKAYRSQPEVATIALNTGANQVDYVGSVTSYRNFNGQETDWIQNYYLQVSLPVGLDVKLFGKGATFVGLATTIQPTYILGENAYLLSTDYKNYTQAPSLSRHWNASTSIAPYISYSTGTLRWEVGPQVRYQLLSSFVSAYPLKENLFDFGLKVGLSLDRLTPAGHSK